MLFKEEERYKVHDCFFAWVFMFVGLCIALCYIYCLFVCFCIFALGGDWEWTDRCGCGELWALRFNSLQETAGSFMYWFLFFVWKISKIYHPVFHFLVILCCRALYILLWASIDRPTCFFLESLVWEFFLALLILFPFLTTSEVWYGTNAYDNLDCMYICKAS